MANKSVYGIVSPAGDILSGSGYLIDHPSTGIYTVLFSEPFNIIPAVVATQVYPNDIHNHTGYDTTDNAVILGIANDRCIIKTGDSHGGASDRPFSFIATGL